MKQFSSAEQIEQLLTVMQQLQQDLKKRSNELGEILKTAKTRKKSEEDAKNKKFIEQEINEINEALQTYRTPIGEIATLITLCSIPDEINLPEVIIFSKTIVTTILGNPRSVIMHKLAGETLEILEKFEHNPEIQDIPLPSYEVPDFASPSSDNPIERMQGQIYMLIKNLNSEVAAIRASDLEKAKLLEVYANLLKLNFYGEKLENTIVLRAIQDASSREDTKQLVTLIFDTNTLLSNKNNQPGHETKAPQSSRRLYGTFEKQQSEVYASAPNDKQYTVQVKNAWGELTSLNPFLKPGGDEEKELALAMQMSLDGSQPDTSKDELFALQLQEQLFGEQEKQNNSGTENFLKRLHTTSLGLETGDTPPYTTPPSERASSPLSGKAFDNEEQNTDEEQKQSYSPKL